LCLESQVDKELLFAFGLTSTVGIEFGIVGILVLSEGLEYWDHWTIGYLNQCCFVAKLRSLYLKTLVE
jgi:hypothetical protein